MAANVDGKTGSKYGLVSGALSRVTGVGQWLKLGHTLFKMFIEPQSSNTM